MMILIHKFARRSTETNRFVASPLRTIVPKRGGLALMLATCLVWNVSPLRGQTATESGDWSNAATWGGTVPDSTTAVATLDKPDGSSLTITVNGSFDLLGLVSTGVTTNSGPTLSGGTLNFADNGYITVNTSGTNPGLRTNFNNGTTLNFTGETTITINGTQSFWLQANSSIQGAGSTIFAGTGTSILSGSLQTTGATTISSGAVVRVGVGDSSAADGALGTATVNNGTLIFRQLGNRTHAGNISGTGSLTKQGSGTLTLTGANSYGGGTTISNGTLRIGNGSTTGSITGNITNNTALVFDRSDDFTFGDVVSGNGTVTKQGAGVLTLGGTNTYSGGTTISAGTLQLGATGSIGSSFGINIASGATFDVSALASGFTLGASQTLSGNGTILGNVTTVGTLSPGNSTGELQFTGDLLLDSAAMIEMEIASLSDFDRIVVDSMLTYGGTLTLSFLDGYLPAIGDTFELFQGFSSHSGTFADIAFPTSGYAASFDYGTGQLTFTAIPEPNTFVFLGISALATAFLGRHRRLSC